MGVPVEFDVTVTGSGVSSDWLPLNRWSSATHRIHTDVTGTVTFSIVGTHENILKNGFDLGSLTSDDELEVAGYTDQTADKQTVQELLYRGLKVNVTAGDGSVRVRVQSEGEWL